MVCGIDSTLPANRTAASTEVMPSVLDEMHFIGYGKAASLAGRAKLKPEPRARARAKAKRRARAGIRARYEALYSSGHAPFDSATLSSQKEYPRPSCLAVY